MIGLRWGYIYINKGVTDALVLTYLNLASSNVCQKQGNGDALWGVLYTALIGFERFYRSLSIVLSIYLHWRGAFGVARFDNQGNAKAFMAWNE